ncbi:hypothetical protein FSP39_006893 [Pinctada imbricata]|uniref:Cilia- and flagella-associated protein 97 n=1 Tax=Pinctada imbricata TaxID=66713 RepID=A0AA88Y800_PINIB|nr:hypothetical protein FSP39_006893 [Pinctada imbricata]
MASTFKTASGENVDFDFFSTPRNDDVNDDESVEREERIYFKPPPSVKQPKHGEDLRKSDSFSANKKRDYSSDSSDSDVSSDVETDSSHSKGSKRSASKKGESKVKEKKYTYSDSESSSAYSDSSSDDESKIIERERIKNQSISRDSKFNRPSDKDIAQNRPSSSKEAWGSGIEKVEIVNKRNVDSDKELQRARPKSGKYSLERGKSASDSEMTDVSPLPSPHDVDNDQVQYDSIQNGGGEIKLESKKLDLSILMEAVSEIENNNRQQRIRNNTRRVMFEPPVARQKTDKSNFSFDQNRVKIIEKENQRLLNEIMKHIGPNKKPKKKFVHEPPTVQKATPSAINRQRQQRRIEEENMAFLRRLQTTKPTRGMSRSEQITEYQRTVLHGVPIAAIHDAQSTLDRSMYGPGTTRSVSSTQGSLMLPKGRRSRPSSAKSNASSIRSRPSSAKSSASVMSRPSSAKSNRSADNRPAWNDRFAYT